MTDEELDALAEKIWAVGRGEGELTDFDDLFSTELPALVAEIRTLRRRGNDRDIEWLQTVELLEAEVRTLRAALAFYADASNHDAEDWEQNSPVRTDGGEQARAALGTISGGSGDTPR